MASYKLSINGNSHSVEADPKMPLLWVLRDLLNLTGTKYGCGMAQCGACTVHLNGNAIRSCSMPVSAVGTQKITTIEGLSTDNSHAVQQAWIAEQVPQCGYCQTGPDHVGRSIAETKSQSNRPGYRYCHAGKYLPLRHLSPHYAKPFIKPPI